MKYCSKCGTHMDDNVNTCPNCGTNSDSVNYQNNQQNSYQANPQNSYQPGTVPDAPSFGWALLGFLIPIVGLILYLVWKDETPLKAKSCGKGALVSVILSVVVGIIWGVVLGSILAGAGASTYYYYGCL